MSNEYDDNTTLYRLTQVENELKGLKTLVTELHNKMISTHFCPAPGTCLALQRIQEDHTKQIAALERWQGHLIGALSVLIPLSGILGPKISEILFK